MGLPENNVKSFKLPEIQKISFKIPEIQLPTTIAPLQLNGNGNYGQVGDGFERSSSDQDEQIVMANYALSSDDKRIVATAYNGVKAFTTTPENSTVVGAASTKEAAEESQVTTAEGEKRAADDTKVKKEGAVDGATKIKEAAEATTAKQKEDVNQ